MPASGVSCPGSSGPGVLAAVGRNRQRREHARGHPEPSLAGFEDQHRLPVLKI